MEDWTRSLPPPNTDSRPFFESLGEDKATLKLVAKDGTETSAEFSYTWLKNAHPVFAAHFYQDEFGEYEYTLLTECLRSGQNLAGCVKGDHYDFEEQDDVPNNMLVHAEMFSLGHAYDIPELYIRAQQHFACYLPAACYAGPESLPSNFISAIRFIYDQEQQSSSVREQLAAYCLSHFKNNLSDHEGFKELVMEIPQFVKDLCRENFKRDFQDDCKFFRAHQFKHIG
jgi:hypothetical protein